MADLVDTVTNTNGDEIEITTGALTGETAAQQQARHDEALQAAENS